MRKFVLVILPFFIFVSSFATQKIIENPDKPLNANAGRSVQLKEVMRIREDAGQFYFEYPQKIGVAPNGFIFVLDKEQLLQFDENGRFIRNLFKKGEGPNETDSILDFHLAENMIFAQGKSPYKILHFNYNGNAIKEKIIHEKVSAEFQLFHKSKYYFFYSDRFIRGKGILEVANQLLSLSDNDRKMKTKMSFLTKDFAVSGRGAKIFIPLFNLYAAPCQNRFLFVTHTSEYLIKLYDAETEQILKIFRRDYKRIKWDKSKKHIKLGGESINIPSQKYENDITNLLVSGDKLWVITSTKDKKKGTLIDVFSLQGEFIDNFYLKLPVEPSKSTGLLCTPNMAVAGNFLFAIELDEEESLYSIVKYKMEGRN